MRPTLVRLSLIVALAGLGLALLALALLPAAMGLVQANRASSVALDLGPLEQRSYVYAADGSVLATLHAEVDRQPVALSEIPAVTVNAVLSVEDSEFFIHDGVNLRATLRALVRNVDQGDVVQGGSTITQQLVKAELVGDERTVGRKAREAVLARRLEEEMTKEEILERYMNTVYLGNGAYGVQAGAETYFGIEASQLDAAQSAFLAGLIGSPAAFDPIRHPEASRARRDVALSRMVDAGRLDPERARVLEEVPIPTSVNRAVAAPDSYFVEEVKQLLLDDPRLGETREQREQATFRGGLQIFTTLDPTAQRFAEQSRDDVLAEVSPPGTPSGTTPLARSRRTGAERHATAAVVSVEPGTGAVRAMVGGPGFADAKTNIVTGRGTNGVGRSGGSTFKIFVLTALLENGYVPVDTVDGSGPCAFSDIPGLVPDPYPVQNFDNSVGGVGTLTEQTLRSSNCAFVRLGQVVGIDEVIDQARKMGITTAMQEVASLPLGTEEVLPIDMAGAMASLAADGLHAEPYLIDRVADRDGKTIFSHERTVRRAQSAKTARLVTEVLEANVRSGTGTRARIPGQHAAGKTGTGMESSDAWFVGATPYLATAVWLGSPTDNEPVVIRGSGITGGNYPAEIWGRFMRSWHEGKAERAFLNPGATRAGRFLSLPGNVDVGGTTSSSTLFPGQPPGFTLPPDFTWPSNYTFPTSSPRPSSPRPTSPPPSSPPPTRDPDDRFGPGFPFDD